MQLRLVQNDQNQKLETISRSKPIAWALLFYYRIVIERIEIAIICLRRQYVGNDSRKTGLDVGTASCIIPSRLYKFVHKFIVIGTADMLALFLFTHNPEVLNVAVLFKFLKIIEYAFLH